MTEISVTLQWSAFEVVGEVPARRAYHSAVAMRFKLLVFGGQGAACMGDLWQFSPGTSSPLRCFCVCGPTLTQARCACPGRECHLDQVEFLAVDRQGVHHGERRGTCR